MKRGITALLALLLLGLALAAQADMTLYVAKGTISSAQADALAQIVGQTLGEPVELIEQIRTGESLSEMMLAGRAPQLAIVPAQQAMPWAREGMLLSLDGCVSDVRRMEEAVVDACVADERMILAPLFARHHAMAVSAARFADAGMDYLMDARAHPVWYPSQVVQALDEMALEGSVGMEIWPGEGQDALAAQALLQGVSGARLTDALPGGGDDGDGTMEDALEWLEDMTRAGLIGAAQSRQAALDRFLAGETAVFIDWTDAETQMYGKQMEEMGIEIRPYPSSNGVMLRAWELVGVCAAKSGDEEEDALLRRAVSLMTGDPRALAIFGDRAIFRDGATWLPCLDAYPHGTTLFSLFASATGDVVAGSANAQDAAGEIARAMETLGE